MESKKTIVLGASTNPSRYSNMAVKKLLNFGHEVIPVGIKNGKIENLEIVPAIEVIQEVDTITLYLGPQNQPEYYDYVEAVNPKRVIFNPGTINIDFMERLRRKGIVVEDACTLVMLSAGTY
jgi:predicted CoA-binding protein